MLILLLFYKRHYVCEDAVNSPSSKLCKVYKAGWPSGMSMITKCLVMNPSWIATEEETLSHVVTE